MNLHTSAEVLKDSYMLLKAFTATLLAFSQISCTSLGTSDNTAASQSAAANQVYSFGLWGDMPYARNGDVPRMAALLENINQSNIAFSIYDGDIKDGSSKCSDDVYTDALKMFGTLTTPVVYGPGDNEWTDCHRLNNGGYDNLERLSHLRRVMFPTLNSLGQQQMPLQRQGALGQKFVENVLFTRGSVIFSGLNVPGSNNNLVLDAKDCGDKSARDAKQCDADNAEYLERDTANVQWLGRTFQTAKQQSAKGIVLVFQADPGFDLPETEGVDESKATRVRGYQNFMAAVIKHTEQYAGQVLLVHGDTHFFKIDKPVYGPSKMLTNLTRLQTFGSPHLHWVKVTVDPAAQNIFQIQPVIVRQP
jgi:hypothetical protein